jgi:hypothetical protein
MIGLHDVTTFNRIDSHTDVAGSKLTWFPAIHAQAMESELRVRELEVAGRELEGRIKAQDAAEARTLKVGAGDCQCCRGIALPCIGCLHGLHGWKGRHCIKQHR